MMYIYNMRIYVLCRSIRCTLYATGLILVLTFACLPPRPRSRSLRGTFSTPPAHLASESQVKPSQISPKITKILYQIKSNLRLVQARVESLVTRFTGDQGRRVYTCIFLIRGVHRMVLPHPVYMIEQQRVKWSALDIWSVALRVSEHTVPVPVPVVQEGHSKEGVITDHCSDFGSITHR